MPQKPKKAVSVEAAIRNKILELDTLRIRHDEQVVLVGNALDKLKSTQQQINENIRTLAFLSGASKGECGLTFDQIAVSLLQGECGFTYDQVAQLLAEPKEIEVV